MFVKCLWLIRIKWKWHGSGWRIHRNTCVRLREADIKCSRFTSSSALGMPFQIIFFLRCTPILPCFTFLVWYENCTLISQQVNVLFRDTSLINSLEKDVPLSDREVEATGAICAFLHVIFNTLPIPIERIMTGLAYRTEIVRVLWRFIKLSHENHMDGHLHQSSQDIYLEMLLVGFCLQLFSVLCTSKIICFVVFTI